MRGPPPSHQHTHTCVRPLPQRRPPSDPHTHREWNGTDERHHDGQLNPPVDTIATKPSSLSHARAGSDQNRGAPPLAPLPPSPPPPPPPSSPFLLPPPRRRSTESYFRQLALSLPLAGAGVHRLAQHPPCIILSSRCLLRQSSWKARAHSRRPPSLLAAPLHRIIHTAHDGPVPRSDSCCCLA